MQFELTSSGRMYCLGREYPPKLQEAGFKIETRTSEHDGGIDYYATIEIDTIEELIRLMDVLEERLVLFPVKYRENKLPEIEIYDDYRE